MTQLQQRQINNIGASSTNIIPHSRNMDASTTNNVPEVYAAPQDVPSVQPPSPTSSEIAATVPSSAEPSPAPAARLLAHMLYKNRLHEFAQKSSIALPTYETANEGIPHAPRFRSTVWVNERSYTTQITFSNRKAAEQDAARIALESILKVIKDEGIPLVSKNIMFSKSILNEYATKLNVEIPTYNTAQLQGVLPVFVSTLVFCDTKYTGDVSRNKKEAEQLAAGRAILSILDEPSSGTLFEIIKSKTRFFAAVKPNTSQSIDASNVSDIANTGHAFVSPDHKDKEVAAPVLPNVSFQTGSEQPTGDGSNSKKRRKNKKANKKARMESPLPVAAFPVNEMPPCSVAM